MNGRGIEKSVGDTLTCTTPDRFFFVLDRLEPVMIFFERRNTLASIPKVLRWISSPLNKRNRQQGNRHWISFSFDLRMVFLFFVEKYAHRPKKVNGTHTQKEILLSNIKWRGTPHLPSSSRSSFKFFLLDAVSMLNIRSSISNTFSVSFLSMNYLHEISITSDLLFGWVFPCLLLSRHHHSIATLSMRDHDQSRMFIWFFFHLLQLLKCTVMIGMCEMMQESHSLNRTSIHTLRPTIDNNQCQWA